jgi:hypothetical protein
MSTVTPAGGGFVVHVEGQHHRHAQFGQQGGQGQGAAQVLGVADLHQAARIFVEQGAHGGAFVVAARRQGQHARRVEQRPLHGRSGRWRG